MKRFCALQEYFCVLNKNYTSENFNKFNPNTLIPFQHKIKLKNQLTPFIIENKQHFFDTFFPKKFLY